MDNYEKKQLIEIQAWEGKKPSTTSKATNIVTKPLELVFNLLIPKKAIEGALTSSNFISQLLTDKNDIIRDGGIQHIAELRTKNLKLSDKLANNVHNWAIGIAATEGAGTGTIGLPGIAIDIPFIVTMALRTVHKIGLCYGYEVNDGDKYESEFAINIIALAGANSMDDKNTSLLALREIAKKTKKVVWKDLEKEVAKKGTKSVINIGLKQLKSFFGRHLTKAVLRKSIPIIGALIGAAVNGQWINDICWAARRSYQKRWLLDNNKISQITESAFSDTI